MADFQLGSQLTWPCRSCQVFLQEQPGVTLSSLPDKTVKLWKVSERDKRPEGYNLKDEDGRLRDPSMITTLRVSEVRPGLPGNLSFMGLEKNHCQCHSVQRYQSHHTALVGLASEGRGAGCCFSCWCSCRCCAGEDGVGVRCRGGVGRAGTPRGTLSRWAPWCCGHCHHAAVPV